MSFKTVSNAIVMACLAAGANAAQAQTPAPTTSPSNSLRTTLPKPSAQKNWRAIFSASYYPETRTDNDSYTELLVDLRYKLTDFDSLRLVQTATKYQVVGMDEPELEAQDTSLQYTRTLSKDWQGFDWKLRPALTLPVSRESGTQSIITRPGLTLIVSRNFFGSKLNATYAPGYTYQVNRYQTRVNGQPLREHSLGHTLTLTYSFTDKLSTTAYLRGVYNWDQRSPYAKEAPRAKGSYLYDFSVAYDALKDLSLSLGCSQGDSFIKDGRYEINVYDPAVTRIYMGLSASI